jgi:hypothetical protein
MKAGITSFSPRSTTWCSRPTIGQSSCACWLNGTVVIENIERHVELGEPVEMAIINGAREVGIPTFLSTLRICIVFVPVFMLQGTRRDTQYSRAQWRQ